MASTTNGKFLSKSDVINVVIMIATVVGIVFGILQYFRSLPKISIESSSILKAEVKGNKFEFLVIETVISNTSSSSISLISVEPEIIFFETPVIQTSIPQENTRTPYPVIFAQSPEHQLRFKITPSPLDAVAVSTVSGEGRIVAEFPGLTDPEDVLRIIKETGQLQFVDLGNHTTTGCFDENNCFAVPFLSEKSILVFVGDYSNIPTNEELNKPASDDLPILLEAGEAKKITILWFPSSMNKEYTIQNINIVLNFNDRERRVIDLSSKMNYRNQNRNILGR